MAHTILDNFLDGGNESGNATSTESYNITVKYDGQDSIDLPNTSFVQDADMTRHGTDLVLHTDEGTVVIEGYYTATPAPNLVAPDGQTLTPELVESFSHGGNEYADAGSNMNDVSPVGAVQEVTGEATVTRVDGTMEKIEIGTPIYQGDVVDTEMDGAVNIMFVDETTFAVSEDARLAIDEYVFDPATQSGTTNFSVLKGVFVFTSGIVGRDDPDDVMIDTPAGSIGIRGTIIAGNATTGEITVVEGAIVLHDHNGNSVTLAEQYETARFDPVEGTINHLGTLSANDVGGKFESVSDVSGTLFSSIVDSSEEAQDAGSEDAEAQETEAQDGEASEDSQGEDAPLEEDRSGFEDVLTSEEIAGLDPAGAPEGPETVTSLSGTPQVGSGSLGSSNSGPGFGPLQYQQQVQVNNPFQVVEVNKFPFLEGQQGADVMRLEGIFGTGVQMHLVGVAQNFYDLIDEGDGTFLIRLKPLVSLDAEYLKPSVTIEATDANNNTVLQSFEPQVINMDEATFKTDYSPNIVGSENYFVVTQDHRFSHDFSKEFADPEGINGYQLVTDMNDLVVNNIIEAGWEWNAQTGHLAFWLTSSASGGVGTSEFSIDVRPVTSTALSPPLTVFDFDIITTSTTATTMITGNNTAHHLAGNAAVTIVANDVHLFMDNVDNTINVSGTGAYTKSGFGNDLINQTSGDGFQHYGEDGNDFFNFQDGWGLAYGGRGFDTFSVNSTNALADLDNANTTFDGGSEIDVLKFTFGGAINLSNISDNVDRIEIIDTDNALGNVITLDYDDIISMKSGNKLLLDMDSNDSLTFNNTSANEFHYGGQQQLGALTVDVYTDGKVTLMVDTDVPAANVTGII